MRKAILLMLFCGSANAAMYSCMDNGGKKVLRSEPCEQNEKQQPIVIKADPSYYIINSTGEKQGVDSYQTKQAPKPVAQSDTRKLDDRTNGNRAANSGAPKTLYEQAKAIADASPDQRPEVRAGIMDRVIRSYKAEHGIVDNVTSPPVYIQPPPVYIPPPPPPPPVIIYQY